MAVRIVDDACRLEDGKIVIVIEGNNPEEVLSLQAKTLAQSKVAAAGHPRAGLNGQSGSYPVDTEGKTQ